MNEHYKELLLLRNREWKELKTQMAEHHAFGTPVPDLCQFAVALTTDQWQNLCTKLDKLRIEKKPALDKLRKERNKQSDLETRREYMKVYMRSYRAQKRKAQQTEVDSGQSCAESGS